MLAASLLPKNPVIVLFRMDEPLDCDAFAMRPVRNQVLSESPDAPQPDSRMFPFADFAGNTHLGHAGQFGICPVDSFSKTPSYFEASVFCQVGVMDDEVLPRGGALYDPRHVLGGFTVPGEFQALAFHGVKLILGDFGIVTALLRFIEQHFQPAAEVLIDCDRLTASSSLENFRLGPYQFCDECIGIRITARADLFFDEFLERIWNRNVHRRSREPDNFYATSFPVLRGLKRVGSEVTLIRGTNTVVKLHTWHSTRNTRRVTHL